MPRDNTPAILCQSGKETTLSMGGYQQSPVPQGAPVTGVTQVTIRNYTYQPPNIQVNVGTTVTWTNQDNVPLER